MSTIESNSIVYTNCSSYLLVGLNVSSKNQNAVASGKKLSEEIVIPYSVDNIPVKVIGIRAFAHCLDIKSVLIEAKITAIHERAFSNTYNLESINIPNTCVFIGKYGIDPYNGSCEGPGQGTLTIRFEQGSKLEFVDENGISQKEKIIIYYCERKAPKTHDSYIYQKAKEVIIYSPTKINFGGVMSTKRTFHCSCVIQNSPKQKRCFSLSTSMCSLILSIC